MRLLLIEPFSNIEGLNTSLGWLSASVRAAGHETFVLSMNNRHIMDYEKMLPDFINRYTPDMIGLSVVCTTYTLALNMVEYIGRHFKGHIVLGGAQMSFEREKTLEDYDRIDFVVVGEGEETLVKLMEHLETGENLQDIKGLIYRDNGVIKVNPSFKWISDLNKLPFPDYRLFGLKSLRPEFPYRVSTSRSCPFRCVFCNPHTMQGKWRSRDFGLAIEELKFAKAELGIRRFDICEPVFNLTVDRVIEFCELLIKEQISMPWICNSGLRADKITDEMMKVMKRSGFERLKIGVETLSREVFPNINKGETIEDIIRAVEIGKKNDLKVSGSFIIGLPGSTYKTSMESFEQARRLGFDEMAWSMLIPYPGTPAYDWVMAHGTMYYDYKEMHQYAQQVIGDDRFRVPFETPEFPMEDRIKAWEKIHWILKAASIGQWNKSVFWKVWKTIYSLARYDPWNVWGNLSYIFRGVLQVIKRRKRPKGQHPWMVLKDLDELPASGVGQDE